MARGLAFVQLIIVCLGVFTLHLLGRLNHHGDISGFIPSLGYFLGRYALWLIPIPILWAVFGNMLTARFGKKTTNFVGLTLTIILFVIFAVPLFWYLG
ncbi:MAG: hypothetical protein ABI443_13535 [Chthoniobacterales bacterium]